MLQKHFSTIGRYCGPCEVVHPQSRWNLLVLSGNTYRVTVTENKCITQHSMQTREKCKRCEKLEWLNKFARFFPITDSCASATFKRSLRFFCERVCIHTSYTLACTENRWSTESTKARSVAVALYGKSPLWGIRLLVAKHRYIASRSQASKWRGRGRVGGKARSLAWKFPSF